MVQMEGKRGPVDTKVDDKPKKQKPSESGKPDKGQPAIQPVANLKRRKNKKLHAHDNKKLEKFGNDMNEKRNLVQKIDKMKKGSESKESKDDVQQKKKRKRKQSKSKTLNISISVKVTGNKNLTKNDKGHGSEKESEGAMKKRKENKNDLQSQSENKAPDKLEKEVKSSPYKTPNKRKRKLKDKIDGETNPNSEKHRKIDSKEGSNKDNWDRKDKMVNPSSKMVRKEKLGNGHAESEKTKRTPLTDRQKHKRMKLKEKRKLKRTSKYKKTDQSDKKEEELDASKHKAEKLTETKPKFEKVVLPKGPEDASANWKKLQSILDAKKTEKETKKVSKQTENETKKVGHKPHPYRRNNKTERKKKGVSKEQLDKPSEMSPPDIWFDDVDEIYLEPAARSKPPIPVEPVTTPEPDNKTEEKKPQVTKNPLVKQNAYKGLTKVVSMDCEMVGVGDGKDNMLARVSIVNQHGEMIYDKFVKPMEDVIDFRTHVSGVREEDIEKGEEFPRVQGEVANILKGRLLVGHAIMNDLKVLYLSHPKKRIRDTSRYKPFRQLFQGRTPSLKKLSAQVLSVKVQEGEHNSVQDAQAAMRLYTMYRKQWETEIRQRKKLQAKDKVLPVVDAESKKSVYQKKRDKSVLDKRKREKKKKEK